MCGSRPVRRRGNSPARPFLPGDSLLFVVGALCGAGMINLPLTLVLLTAAAILDDQCNYTIDRHFNPHVFQ